MDPPLILYYLYINPFNLNNSRWVKAEQKEEKETGGEWEWASNADTPTAALGLELETAHHTGTNSVLTQY